MEEKVKSILCLISAMILFSCSNNASDEIQIYQENGVTIVHNPATPIDKEIRKLNFIEELSIGSESTDENYLFYRAWFIDVDSKGNCYVLDRGNHRIQKFDLSGNYTLTIGRKGQGPGEFESPNRILINSKDQIIVNDGTNRRITVFNSEGVRLFDYKTDDLFPRFPGLQDFLLTKEDNILFSISEIDFESKIETRTFKTMDTKGNINEELFSIEYPVFAIADGARGIDDLVRVHVDIDAKNNIFTCYQNRYSIVQFGEKGNRLRNILREFNPTHLTAEEKEKAQPT
ncbi:6-bladed beta-propeller [candidate division KSB1 bacterium]|nr:6-bladed beta-propeller [candidate division KSB1 bacterium]